ncbi:geranylgeranyl reductase family protein [Chloroflexota bacterium]
MIYDVIVVGAGPAGAVLAYHLASLGLRVRILEKARLPREKVCGGGLTFKARQSLPFDPEAVVEHKSSGGILAYKGQPLIKVDTARPIAWLVMRNRFDHFLVKKAVEAGAQLSDGQTVRSIETKDGRVTVFTAQENCQGRILVGADGVHSLVARSAGLLAGRQTGVAIEAELAVPDSALERQGAYATFDFGALPFGYGWIFPKRNHLSVGAFHARPGKAPQIKQFFRKFVASNAVLYGHTQLSLRGHHIPLGGGRAPLQRGQVLLVGDAANLADAWLGEGLYYAIQSANIAANVIADAFKMGSLRLDAYDTRIGAEILPQLIYARIFAWWVYRFPRLGVYLTHRSEYMQDVVFGAMRGDHTFREMISRLLFGLPRILLQALARHAAPPTSRYQP